MFDINENLDTLGDSFFSTLGELLLFSQTYTEPTKQPVAIEIKQYFTLIRISWNWIDLQM